MNLKLPLPLGAPLGCAAHLLHEPADRGRRCDRRERRAALDRARSARRHLRSAVVDRRLHRRDGEPADAVRLARRPPRAQAGVHDRPGAVPRGFGAVQHRLEHRHADRLPRAAGGRWLDAQPGGDVDHHQHLHRAAGARAGGRDLGSDRRASRWRSGPVVGGALVSGISWRAIFLLERAGVPRPRWR